MSTEKRRFKTRVTLIVLGVGGLLAMVVGLPIYLNAEAAPLHPRPESAPSVAVAEPSQQWAAAVRRARQITRASLAGQNLPGLSIAVGAGGDIVWSEGFGWADVETRAPVTPETRFRIGTASTVLTSAAVGVLLEKDRLALDDEIQTHVPQFPRTQWPVTLRQLMAHVAGIGSDTEDDRPLSRQRCERPIGALPQFADGSLMFEPGTEYRHSKYGWILVSAAIEAAGGQPFLAFMRDQVFRPLGMEGTDAESTTEENPEHIGEPSEDAPFLTLLQDVVFEPLGLGGKARSTTGARLATFYVPGFGRDALLRHRLHVKPARNLSCYAGSMAFFSTPSDLVRFGLAIDSGKLLQPATARLLQAAQRLTSGKETGRGLGWDMQTVTFAGVPTQVVGHIADAASNEKATMSLILFRERGIVVAVASNASHADTSAVALQVAEAFAN